MKNNLLHLLHLSDPNLPIGAFSHSYGLETYIQNKSVYDFNTAKKYVQEMLSHNLFYNDAAYLTLGYRALETNRWQNLLDLDHHCEATKLPQEIRLASQKLGWRLIKIFQKLLNNSNINKFEKAIVSKETFGHHAIAYGLVAFALDLDIRSSLTGFYFNAMVGFVTNCVKMVPLGQEVGQQLIFESNDLVGNLVEQSLLFNEELLGLCSIGFDVRSMEHEALYSRLYMS